MTIAQTEDVGATMIMVVTRAVVAIVIATTIATTVVIIEEVTMTAMTVGTVSDRILRIAAMIRSVKIGVRSGRAYNNAGNAVAQNLHVSAVFVAIS